ncbi:hypothetical protein LLG10_05920 [bacterium]|nr:hypothetical protein [bacterium]
MTFLIVMIGCFFVIGDLFFFPSLTHFSLYIDIAMIWILFSMDIQEEESVYAFLLVLLIKTLFLSHALVLPYIFTLSVLYCLYYFVKPFFYQRESWLSFFLVQFVFIGQLLWLYHVTWGVLITSSLYEIASFFLLLLLRKRLRQYHTTNRSRYITSL